MAAPKDEQTAFLAAIRDDPDNDAPRLAFADWLEEYGNPRGEFIHVQCKLARMKKTDPGRKKLKQREKELLQKHGKEWKGRPPRWSKVKFQRGLLTVTVDAEELLEDRGLEWWIDNQGWVSLVDVELVNDEHWGELIARDLLTQVSSLALRHAFVKEAGLKHLAGLTQLRTLDLLGNDTNMTDAVLKRLALLTHLMDLNLRLTAVTDAGLKHLAKLTQLKVLNLHQNRVKGPGLKHLAKLTQLEMLDLGDTKVTGPGLEHLAGLARLHTLNLSATKVKNAGMKHLATLTRLTALDLGYTAVTAAGIEYLAKLTQLQTLNLTWTKVTDAGAEHLQKLSQLERLDLTFSEVSFEARRKLKKALPHCTIR